MKLLWTIWWLISAFLIVQCNSLKNSQKNSSQEVNNQIVRLKVSFISIGQGINFEAVKYFSQVIEKFNKEQKVNLKYDKIPWGREGEFNYCFYEQKKIDKFIELTKKEMKKYENVELHENPLNCDR